MERFAFTRLLPQSPDSRVLNSVAAGRRLALRAVALQAAAGLLVAALYLTQGPHHALAAAIGGVALALGNGLAALIALGGGFAPAGTGFARLLLSVLGKWAVVAGLLVMALGPWRLPPVPVLVGLIAGMVVYLLALNLGGKD